MEQVNPRGPQTLATLTKGAPERSHDTAQPSAAPVATSWRKQDFTRRSLFTPRRAVGLDIAGDLVSVVEVCRHGKDFEVRRAGSAGIVAPKPGSPPGARRAALATAIKQALAKAGINTTKVVVNLPGDPAECNVRTFPSMPIRELEAVLGREGAELYGEGTAWDYLLLSGQKDSELHVIAAYVPDEKVTECMALLKDCGLRASSICASHLALLSLAQRMVKGDDTTALVHLGKQAVSVIILADGEPSLVRRIQLEQETDNSPEYVVQEIERTFLYFKQESRGKRVTEVIQSGASERVIALLEQMPDISLADFASIPFSVGDASLEFSPVAAGLAAMGTTGTEMNLLPSEIKERPIKGIRAASMLVAAAIAVGIFAACYLTLHMAERMYGQALGKLRADAANFVAMREEHSEIKALKTKLNHRRQVHAKLLDESLPWPCVLWGLGKIVPPNVHLTEISASRRQRKGDMQWKLKIAGELLAEGEGRSRVLRGLLDRLQESGLFTSIELDPLKDTSVGGPMHFSIRCEALPADHWKL